VIHITLILARRKFSDVTEPNADPTGQTVGGQLIVDGIHSYADLDELIVNHVQAMARRVEELMAHEKFKHGTEDELREHGHS
jgi:transcription elongation factor SPT6